jgi:hypothetical protein
MPILLKNASHIKSEKDGVYYKRHPIKVAKLHPFEEKQITLKFFHDEKILCCGEMPSNFIVVFL